MPSLFFLSYKRWSTLMVRGSDHPTQPVHFFRLCLQDFCFYSLIDVSRIFDWLCGPCTGHVFTRSKRERLAVLRRGPVNGTSSPERGRSTGPPHQPVVYALHRRHRSGSAATQRRRCSPRHLTRGGAAAQRVPRTGRGLQTRRPGWRSGELLRRRGCYRHRHNHRRLSQIEARSEAAGVEFVLATNPDGTESGVRRRRRCSSYGVDVDDQPNA